MNVELFGNWAGSVWNALNEKGTLGAKAIKKATKLKDKELFAALGWLAREGKIEIAEVEGELTVTLVG